MATKATTGKKCSTCKFVRHDYELSEDGWTAYQCWNTESVYFRALLNVSVGGDMLKRVTWTGCKYYMLAERGVAI